MAEYTRFEIYIPVVYRVKEPDPHSGKERPVTHALNPQQLQAFIDEIMGRYHGITQANPLAPAPYKGWWQARKKRKIDIDFLTFLFGLVRIDQTEAAQSLFDQWKRKFELTLHQDVILVLYYPVQTIGDFFDT